MGFGLVMFGIGGWGGVGCASEELGCLCVSVLAVFPGFYFYFYFYFIF